MTHVPKTIPLMVLDTFLRDAIKTRDIIMFELEDGNTVEGIVIDFDEGWATVEIMTEDRAEGFVSIVNLKYVTQISS